MNDRACPSFEELSRFFSEGEPGAFRDHVASCAVCSAAWQDLETLRAAAQQIPVHTPTSEDAARLEDLLVTSTHQPASRPSRVGRYVVPLVAASVAAGLTFFVINTNPRRPDAKNGHVTAANASYEHFTRYDGDDRRAEIVRVTSGQVRVQVDKLSTHETFTLKTSDGEVEVRGTVFDVDVQDDVLMGVRVTEGRVVVRVPGRPEQILDNGEAWSRSTVRSAVADTVDEPVATPAEQAFEYAWASLKSGKFDKAADGFRDVAANATDPSLADDAAYWRAVALTRNDSANAAEALRDYLERDTSSERAHELRVLLGWQLVARGDPEGARDLFEAARGSTDPRVRAAAAQGLDRTQAMATP